MSEWMCPWKTQKIVTKFLQRGLVPAVGLFLINLSCGRVEPNDSTINQLTDKDFACYLYSEGQRTAHLREMPPSMVDFGSFRQGNPEDVKNQLTGIPKPLLEYLYGRTTQNRFSISEARLGRGTMGVTLLRGFNALAMEPESIRIAAVPEAVNFALQHEVGHAIESQVKRNDPQRNQQNWRIAFQEGLNNRKLRAYARESAGEYFAESFANFYCSPDAHNFISQELPQTYRLLRDILPPPRWEESQGPQRTADGSATPRSPRVQPRFFVYLEPTTSNRAYIYVASSSEVKNIDLCLDTKKACQQKTVMEPSFTIADKQIAGQSVLRSKDSVSISPEMQFTIHGLGDGGEKLGSRSIVIKKRS
jgi:hypothetical protein